MSRDNGKKRKTSSPSREELYAQQLRDADDDVDREKREYAGHKFFGHLGGPNVGVNRQTPLDYSVADIEDALNNPPAPLPQQKKKRISSKSRGGKSKKNKAKNAKSKKYRRN